MKESIARQIADLESMTLEELRVRWRDLYGTEPPGYSKAHLVRRLAYRIQELAHGGVSEATCAKLRAIAEQDGGGGQVRALVRRDANGGGPVPGTRFVREWHGQRHEVAVVEGGFEYAGRTYRSLTAIAKTITGQHWNGPLFFGLRDRKRGNA